MRYLADFHKVLNGNMHHYIHRKSDATLKRMAVYHFFLNKENEMKEIRFEDIRI